MRNEKNAKYIFNAAFRENDQRNSIINGLNKAGEDDIILISDVDEIPNLKDLNVAKVNNKDKILRIVEKFRWTYLGSFYNFFREILHTFRYYLNKIFPWYWAS